MIQAHQDPSLGLFPTEAGTGRERHELVSGGRLMSISDTINCLLRQLQEIAGAELPGTDKRLGIDQAHAQLQYAQHAIQRASMPFFPDPPRKRR